MTLAIRRNELVRSLVSVDNAPVDASLRNDFPKYVRGLQEVEKFTPVKQTEADSILQQYEEVKACVNCSRTKLNWLR